MTVKRHAKNNRKRTIVGWRRRNSIMAKHHKKIVQVIGNTANFCYPIPLNGVPALSFLEWLTYIFFPEAYKNIIDGKKKRNWCQY